MSLKEESSEAGSKTQNDLITGYSSMEQFTKDGYKTLIEAIKHSNALPTGRDWDFYNAHDSFRTVLQNEGNNVLNLMNTIIRANNVMGNIKHGSLDEKIELVVDANDVILENVANYIDEMNGIRRTLLEPVVFQAVSADVSINESWNKAKISVSSEVVQINNQTSANSITLLTGKNIIRPQTFFKDKIDNSNTAWKPRITDKPNSLKPLAIFLEEFEDHQEFSHPYEFELDRFTPLPEFLSEEEVIKPKSLTETPLIEITKPEQLNDLVETLRNCKVFGVDVEHHSYRSFMGITCLLQISTTENDYIIDTLVLRDKLEILNEVFTKSTIVKIFHGAEKDIQWLQRDLSIYVVNMFDTFQAAKLLDYPRLSLAYLLKHFCDFIPNKQFQLADWRIRPLPDELKAYAREDTHYLIYIYQMLKIELLKKNYGQNNFLKAAFERSTDVCKMRYFKPILRDDSHMDLYRKCRRIFDNRQLYALKELYAWRDTVSRQEDESTGYVLPNHMLLQISEALPREMQGILACCNPIPPLVRSNLIELHKIVLKAREQPLEKPILKEDTRARGCVNQLSKLNINSPLHCPHDLTNFNEFRDDLPTLLGNNKLIKNVGASNNNLDIEITNSVYSVFSSDVSLYNEIESDVYKKIQKIKFLSPFERYKLVKPFIQAEEENAATEERNIATTSDGNSVTKETEKSSPNDNHLKTNENVGDNRTDEERIASVREHFLNMSKKFQEIAQNEQTVKEQCFNKIRTSKKRKRELSVGEELVNSKHIPPMKKQRQRKRKLVDKIQVEKCNVKNIIKSASEVEGNNENKVSNKRKKMLTRSMKRKQEQNIQQPPNNLNVDVNNKVNVPKKRPSNLANSEQSNKKIKSNMNSGLRRKNKKRKNKQNTGNRPVKNLDSYNNMPPSNLIDQKPTFYDFSSDHFEQFTVAPESSRMLQYHHSNNYMQEQSNFQPFDYSSFDFKQFQGGAGRAGGSQEIKTKFKGKRQNKMKNKNSKSLTFSNNGGRGKRQAL